jgi:hypothetical protein
MLQPVEDEECDELPLALCPSTEGPSLWNRLTHPRVWPRAVEERYVFFDRAIQRAFAQNQEMV